MPSGRVVIISAPSGTGKSTIVQCLLKRSPRMIHSVSATTRSPRANEVPGRDYHFLSESEFRRRAEDGEFAEWAEVHGAMYGTPRAELERHLVAGLDVLLDIDVQGGLELMQAYPEKSISIFLLPPSMEDLERRLRGRGTDHEAAVQLRIKNALEEMKNCERYHYQVVNDDLEHACQTIFEILEQNKK